MDLSRLGFWTTFEGSSLDEAVQVAQRVEALGYGTLWMSMSLRRDLLVTAAHLLANTTDLIVGTAIQATFDRLPSTMVAGQRTLDELSGGRFLLGLGVSHPVVVEKLHGLEYGPPLKTMRAYLDAMDRDLNPAAVFGSDVPAAKTDAPPGRPPRVLAALGPKMLALSGERADGTQPYFMPPEHTREAREILGPDAWLCPEVKVVLEEDPSRAREAARLAGAPNIKLENYHNAWKRFGFTDSDFSDGGSDRLIDATIAWGNQTRVENFIQRHFDAGATQVCLHFVATGDDFGTIPWNAVEALAPK
ncbi:MAG: TIGR03620 family F420-dependent LLM class oxidoreductase [Gammaproteobacteria bacterium]|nr:TIGR03620 family F420-dependent LLM class oxidoreductase [Gammaproteobacteria bacterium]